MLAALWGWVWGSFSVAPGGPAGLRWAGEDHSAQALSHLGGARILAPGVLGRPPEALWAGSHCTQVPARGRALGPVSFPHHKGAPVPMAWCGAPWVSPCKTGRGQASPCGCLPGAVTGLGSAGGTDKGLRSGAGPGQRPSSCSRGKGRGFLGSPTRLLQVRWHRPRGTPPSPALLPWELKRGFGVAMGLRFLSLSF